MKKVSKIVWSSKAKSSLKEIYQYIRKDSPQAAEKVRARIIDVVENLPNFPEKFSREEYLKDQEENFRSISVWRYKIVYELFDDKIIITNIFDGAQDPDRLRD